MNHQVEYYVHVERPWREHAEPVDLEKHRLRDQRKRGAHRGIEALQMPHLRNSAMGLCNLDQSVSFGERWS